VTRAVLAAPVRHVPALLGGLVVLLQIGYPLTSGHLREQLTVLTVVVAADLSLPPHPPAARPHASKSAAAR